MSRIFGVIGDPVSHSLSPVIHGAWIENTNIDATYLAFHVRRSATTVDDIVALGRCGLSGINVTAPHKNAAFRASIQADKVTEDIGAANTLVADDRGQWRAYNTDVDGFSSSMASWYGVGWRDMPTSVLLVGAGGAARAVAYSLGRAGYDLTVANRTRQRARELAREVAPDATPCRIDEVPDVVSDVNIVINATGMGHGGGKFPDIGDGQGRIFFDLSYGAAAQAGLDRMEASGWRVMDGLQMLVAQAARSFHIWFGVEPDQEMAFRLCRERIAKPGA